MRKIKVDGAFEAPSYSNKKNIKNLLLVLVSITLFLSMLYFLDNFSPVFKYGHQKISEEEIEAGAIFYTGVKKVRDAETFIRSSFDYSPFKKQEKNNIDQKKDILNKSKI